MKKAKSQVVACFPLNLNENDLHRHHTQVTNDVVFDPLATMVIDDDVRPDESRAPAAANLSHKKATAAPPQPAKKLMIKLLKGVLLCWISFWIHLWC
ncbi:hypothetical protein SLEP1_g16982 [Rubroshorea leprosula]|uniref:Uncharacterized protein n=1 Tax=Rubroshorea leprosula TaxID=152421 RepID=A0AAV5J1S0_9ROSI|nr:hypothetical protein SLEP1_g16982 [Rubroshorea leprosula]